MTNIVLLLFVTRENTDFTNISTEEMIQHGITERICTTDGHKNLARKNAHCFILFLLISSENVACINLTTNVIKTSIITVGYDCMAICFEL